MAYRVENTNELSQGWRCCLNFLGESSSIHRFNNLKIATQKNFSCLRSFLGFACGQSSWKIVIGVRFEIAALKIFLDILQGANCVSSSNPSGKFHKADKKAKQHVSMAWATTVVGQRDERWGADRSDCDTCLELFSHSNRVVLVLFTFALRAYDTNSLNKLKKKKSLLFLKSLVSL